MPAPVPATLGLFSGISEMAIFHQDRLANVLRVGLRATTPKVKEQDQIIVGPLRIVGDSGSMRITRVVALREGSKGRVVKTTRSEHSLRYFVRANCWQLSLSATARGHLLIGVSPWRFGA